MENQFVPYELAVKLKELGFDEECLYVRQKDCPEFLYTPTDYEDYPESVYTEVLIPLWQQAFDWFREKHDLHSVIMLHSDSSSNNLLYAPMIDIMKPKHKAILDFDDYITHEKAREKCLEKLIEIVSNKIEK